MIFLSRKYWLPFVILCLAVGCGEADIYSDVAYLVRYPNYFLTSYAPFRSMPALDDQSDIIPFPTADPAASWNPATLVYVKKRFVSFGPDVQSESVADSYRNRTFPQNYPFVSSAYYIEPPSPYTIGVIGFGWKQEQRNLDFTDSTTTNQYDRLHWSGGAVWALPFERGKGAVGLMAGYRRLFDAKKSDYNPLYTAKEDYTSELQGFFGKAGLSYEFLPSVELGGAYTFGGNLEGSAPINSTHFYDREPSKDSYGANVYLDTFTNLLSDLHHHEVSGFHDRHGPV